MQDFMTLNMLIKHIKKLQLSDCKFMQNYINQHVNIQLNIKKCDDSYNK